MDSTSFQEKYEKANELYKSGESQDALAILNQLLVQAPGNAAVLKAIQACDKQLARKRLSWKFWLTAFLIPPLANVWAAQLTGSHKRKRTALIATTVWFSILFVFAVGGSIVTAPGVTSLAGYKQAQTAGGLDNVDEVREGFRSDDARTKEELEFHDLARAYVISEIRANDLGVNGHTFRVKRNKAGHGCFVYEPRTTFSGEDLYFLWWVPYLNYAYPQTAASERLFPGLGFDPPPRLGTLEYVFGPSKSPNDWE
ncbi:MAG: hypothetical protein WD873_04545 [Candidatus Hydrogenedentales bacterium]